MWFTESECIQAMKVASHYLGFSFTRNDYLHWQMDHSEYPTAAQIAHRLHGFNEAKVQAGLIPNATVRTSSQFSDDELIIALKNAYQDLGGTFSERSYELWRSRKEKKPSLSTIRNRLGSITELKKRLEANSFSFDAALIYDSDKWKVPLVQFIAGQLSLNAYKKWSREHGAPSVSDLQDYADSYEGALVEAMNRYIQQIKDGRDRD
ncbi:hypothetical protein E4665_16260 [Sporolactobacillus shoreae]|uniref:Uncharacterized protein n=2 Tax=Sporolactobacillus shoreae TaxID=1465501 RepID=A0A4Z0GJU1_9BACL|nr:hypothetical protein E4665_16260 [Sporolactobacillus shoreae]